MLLGVDAFKIKDSSCRIQIGHGKKNLDKYSLMVF